MPLERDFLPVTRPSMPELGAFISALEELWDSKQLTNRGKFHQEFEAALEQHLGVSNLSLVANATIGLLVALKALKVGGEVITTPFSFVATSTALSWAGLTPRFVDIDPQDFNIAANKIERSITDKTTAIMPVHGYANPCNVEMIQNIADRHALKVIYDAAPAFGVKLADRSVLDHGDASVVSLHATKVMNSFEGGFIVFKNKEDKLLADKLTNFGFVDENTIDEAGINAKLPEISAAFGLLQLEGFTENTGKRRAIYQRYQSTIGAMRGLRTIRQAEDVEPNYAYFPIVVEEHFPLIRDKLHAKFLEAGIGTKKYYHPLISNLPMYRDLSSAASENLPVANFASGSVLCLPIYASMTVEEQDRVLAVLESCLK